MSQLTINKLMSLEPGAVISVAQMPDDQRIVFMSDSQDVDATLDHIGELPAGCDRDDYESLFAAIHDGDYLFVFGLTRAIPYLSCTCDKLY